MTMDTEILSWRGVSITPFISFLSSFWSPWIQVFMYKVYASNKIDSRWFRHRTASSPPPGSESSKIMILFCNILMKWQLPLDKTEASWTHKTDKISSH